MTDTPEPAQASFTERGSWLAAFELVYSAELKSNEPKGVGFPYLCSSHIHLKAPNGFLESVLLRRGLAEFRLRLTECCLGRSEFRLRLMECCLNLSELRFQLRVLVLHNSKQRRKVRIPFLLLGDGDLREQQVQRQRPVAKIKSRKSRADPYLPAASARLKTGP